MANWSSGTWRDYSYKRGQFITSLPSLAYETGLSIQEVRTAIKHLKKTGELTDWHDSKVRIITVVNFDKYQGEQQTTQQPFQQASNRQATGKQQQNKNIKNNKKEKNIPAAPEGAPDDPWAWGGPKPKQWTEDDEWSWRNDQSNPENPRMTRMEIWTEEWGESDD
jgi:hypothetical protein